MQPTGLRLRIGLLALFVTAVVGCLGATEARARAVVAHGDANCDDTVDAVDAALMLQHGAGITVTLACARLADVNADAVVDSVDAQLTLQFTAGLMASLPPLVHVTGILEVSDLEGCVILHSAEGDLLLYVSPLGGLPGGQHVHVWGYPYLPDGGLCAGHGLKVVLISAA